MVRLIAFFVVAVVLVGCQKTAVSSSIPESVHFLPREDWGALPPVLPMRKHKIVQLTIHHTGTRQVPGKSLTDKIKGLQKFSQQDSKLANGKTKPAWADVPYHLYVDVNGDVAEGRNVNYAGDSNTAYDPAGHLLVVVEGNFEEEELTPKQLKTLEVLVPALAKRYKIPASRLGGHKDYAETLCPGNKLYAMLPHFQELIGNN